MENDQGKQFILLEKWINYAGLPDFSGKENSSSLMINIFDVENNYQPSRKDIPPSYKGNDNELPFNKIPQSGRP